MLINSCVVTYFNVDLKKPITTNQMKKYIGKIIDTETNETIFTMVISNQSYYGAFLEFSNKATDQQQVFAEIGADGFIIELFVWKK
jgi:hypothetical protein